MKNENKQKKKEERWNESNKWAFLKNGDVLLLD